ncbi:MAG: tetratricopeptide repeat protein [Phycisphaerae bacterium]|nr:tetratricopeptide repeat protein [Phycisphaerae bacterium]
MTRADTLAQEAAGHAQAGRLDQAASLLQQALREDPGHAEANRMMALLLMQRVRPDEALAHLRRAMQTAPQRADLPATVGNVFAWMGKIDDAMGALRQALAIDPRLFQARGLLATCLLQKKRYDEAEDEYRAALAVQPAYPEARTNLGTILTMTGRPREAVEELRDAARAHPNHPGVLTNLCVALNYSDLATPEETAEAHRAYGRLLASLPAPPGPPLPPIVPPRDPRKRLRIGILSPDLFDHSVAQFLAPILEHRARPPAPGAAEWLVYSGANTADHMTRRLQQLVDRWLDIRPMQDADLIRQMRADGLDVLVELSGQTYGNKLMALRLRGAPVQVTAIGYPNTTGVPTIDWRLVDSLTDPPGAEALATERLLRLDPCFLCFSPPMGAPGVEPPPVEANGFITFGSFNSIKKLTPSTLELWARLLHRVPTARLVIKSQGLGSARARATIGTILKQNGIPEARFDLLDKIEDKREHLAAYGGVDVALDTFPYHGTTTTCEALWMGVPTVSLVGRVHAARVGLSLLSAVGLADLAAATPEAFLDAAASLAGDRARLASLRAGMRDRLRASPLCDGPGYAQRFEEAIRGAFRAAAGG